MEKNTIIAIVLSVLVFTGFYALQYYLYPPKPVEQAAEAAASGTSAVEAAPETSVVPAEGAVIAEAPPEAPAVSETAPEAAAEEGPDAGLGEAAAKTEERITIENEQIKVVLSSAGGDIVSYQIKERKKDSQAVEMIDMVLPGAAEPRAFTLAFGGKDAPPVKSIFTVSRPAPSVPGAQVLEFSNFFTTTSGGRFKLTKRYDFREGEYLFELDVKVESASPVALNNNGAAYTLNFGPQIGPRFEKLDNRYEYRHYVTFSGGKRRTVKADELIDINSEFIWAGIAGKYFTAMVIPPNNYVSQMEFSQKEEAGIPQASRFSLIRPALNATSNTDVYYFYLGPKNQENLGKYDTGSNSFKIREKQFIKAANTSGVLSWLENILKLALNFFYTLVHNYGVAIILLTLLVKLLLFPLTKKSSEASIKMQALAPKIKEIQTKYKDNPAKMNAEMGALYKKEGHNPMSGCLPLLIQLPLLWAMYNLFNTHFDLRGAMFIPGWIPDLSLPESIATFNGRLPILGWNSLRALPFIYLGSQLLYGVATRTPDQQGNNSMKMMMYVMPIMFFFILYDVPSGLLVFWIFSNVFTLVQQIILNKYLAKKRAAAAADQAIEAEKTVIAPPRKKKKR
jgi:YidC/Oxa1 family membrane protein insertase